MSIATARLSIVYSGPSQFAGYRVERLLWNGLSKRSRISS